MPDELIIDILASTLDSFKESKGVIFDGFPRTIAQAEALKKMLADRNDDMGMMIELVVDEETLMARLLNRAIEQGRADDNEETIKKRLTCTAIRRLLWPSGSRKKVCATLSTGKARKNRCWRKSLKR